MSYVKPNMISNDSSIPREELFRDFKISRKHLRFENTNLLSAPFPTNYYSEHTKLLNYQIADKPQVNNSPWNGYSRSTISDLKLLDNSNSSSIAYDVDCLPQSQGEHICYEIDGESNDAAHENTQEYEQDEVQNEGEVADESFNYQVEYENDDEYDDQAGVHESAYWSYLNDYVTSGEIGSNVDDRNMQSLDCSDEAQVCAQDMQASHDIVPDPYYQEYDYDEHQQVLNSEDAAEKSELLPFTLEQIEERVEVHSIPGKGRCTFARRDYRPGDIIFVETPLLVATPELDPDLWKILKALHDAQNFELPPTWHLAAISSLKHLSESEQSILFEKWVPDPKKMPSDDVWRVLEATRYDIDPQLYEQALQVWRYNSFGHHSNTNGLALYNRISMLAHDCSASATWHYGVNDAFTLRARQVIPRGGEITLSYIGDEDLLKATHVRQDKLIGWLFNCNCQKCQSPRDTARGFKCPTCGGGSVFFKTVREAYEAVTADATSALQCTICHSTPTAEDIGMYLELEEAYINRLKATPKDDIVDVEHVYSEAQRVFAQHWILYQLDSILVEGYRERKNWDEAIYHQLNRIRYVSQVLPSLSYTLAWLYEELGDIYAGKLDITVGAPLNPGRAYITGFQKNFMVDKYETAMYKLLLISGPENAFTLAAHEKLEYIMELGKGCFDEKA